MFYVRDFKGSRYMFEITRLINTLSLPRLFENYLSENVGCINMHRTVKMWARQVYIHSEQEYAQK